MAESAQYVTLGVGDERFALPVERVREILQMQPIARMPNAPACFLGMIDVRGQGVPVVDLRLKLGFESGEDTETTRIIVLQVTVGGRELTLGLKTDRVFEVTELDGNHLEPPPEIGTSWSAKCITGIGRRNGAFVTVFDLGCLFAASDIAVVERAA
ncbi:chemotaxis protein CheW [Bradyrhizobium manausense]|uniref:chemotaxis protein CheW n=1 Tax=Bradyrhizobium manausense TaxID=989370 RepID=UPI001BAC1195|nr:chemotaxis protein CheW [Bradyrhizobium manausense]MBR0686348.1 chemotaxis protein CheW [Bradyrhizobium manausense]MBR0722346.1 chemotaxis protein CheW [Bradyrhizobium manausense]MBR0833481.1 chemotaxis protein CheW [Bradyrhizobium manausense]